MGSYLADLPVLPPPKGQKSDFDSPAPDARALWAISITFLLLAFSAVVTRLYVKRRILKQRLYWDDGKWLKTLERVNISLTRCRSLYSSTGGQITFSALAGYLINSMIDLQHYTHGNYHKWYDTSFEVTS